MPLDPNDAAHIEALHQIVERNPKPTPQQRLLGAIAVAVEGDAASARHVYWLTWPVVIRPSTATLRGLASQVLLAAARATLDRSRPDDLAPTLQAVEAALASWPLRFQTPGGGSHSRQV